MKILQIHNFYREPGGEDQVVAAEASMLRANGHDLRRVTFENPRSTVGAALKLAAAAWNPISAQYVRRELEIALPDVAHIHNTWFSATPSVLQPLEDLEVPVAMTLHNYRLFCSNARLERASKTCTLCTEGNSWNAVRFKCYRQSRTASAAAALSIETHRRLQTWQRRIDAFLVLNNMQRELLIESGVSSKRVHLHPISAPDPGPRDRPPGSSNSVLFVGRLEKEKGIDLLVDAWSKANTGDLRLSIAGDGPAKAEIAQRIPTREVSLLGHVAHDDLAEMISRARALVVPSLGPEGFPVSIVEAFAGGTPVLASARLAVAPLVADVLGPEWVFGPQKQPNFVGALESLANAEACNAAGRAARSHYEEHLSSSQVLSSLEEIYEGILR